MDHFPIQPRDKRKAIHLVEKPRFEAEYDPDTDPDWGKDAEQPKEGAA